MDHTTYENDDIFDKIMQLPLLRVFNPFYKKYKEVLLYLFFGFSTFVITVITFGLFDIYMGINELVANVLSWIIAVTFAFLTNRVWVFNSPTKGVKEYTRQMASFYAGRLLTLAIEEGTILIFVTWLAFDSMPVKIIAQIVVIVLNYIISKLVIFKK